MKLKILLSIVIISLVLICGCESHKSHEPAKLPTNATNVTDKGNGWTIFELDGNRFLYHRSTNGYKGFEAITVIPSGEKQ